MMNLKVFLRVLAVIIVIAAVFLLSIIDFREPFDDLKEINYQIEENPNDYESYKKRGDYYWYLGQYGLVIQDYNKAIELNPNYADAYYNRGLAYQKIGADERAQADFAKAEKLGYKAKNF